MFFHYKNNIEINGNIKYIKPDKNLIKGIYSIGFVFMGIFVAIQGYCNHAPLDYKIKNVMKNYGNNEKQPKKHILDSDKTRATYYGVIANKVWGDKNNYDLCIDARIGNKNVIEIIWNYVKNK